MASSAEIGMIGLATMGRALSLNLLDHGCQVVGWNLEREPGDALQREAADKPFVRAATLADLVAKLNPPRRILLMIKAGAPVDAVLAELMPLLTPGDLVIDGGNAHFADTQRRARTFASSGLELAGLGVSGGESGARLGPSLMFGGTESAWRSMQPTLTAIAAAGSAGPCAIRVGPDASGHFVKMVHNGIEYADMQVIAEAYDLLHRSMRLTADEIAGIFSRWNEGPLRSFLIELTGHVLTRADANGPLVEQILDAAEQKGTGRWAVQTAMELGVAVPSIAAAVDARIISAAYAARWRAAPLLHGPEPVAAAPSIEAIGDALLAAKVCAYAQGLQLVTAGSRAYDWRIAIDAVASVWTGGCIIRAKLLAEIADAFRSQPDLENLALAPAFVELLRRTVPQLRRVVADAITAGVPTPAMASSLAWYDATRSARLPQNLIQAQRDAFGAHTFRRLDDPDTPVHGDWT